MVFKRITSLVLQTTSWLQSQSPLRTSIQTSSHSFEWDNTPAHSHFVWHDCYDGFKCARLQVPMDWLGTSDKRNKTVEIAVIKVEATVPVTDETYGGAVVLNPGGPGNSGISQVLKGGRAVRTILSAGPEEADKSHGKHFDIIGFDPRGVNHSRPALTCFANENEATAWNIEQMANGLIGTSNTAYDRVWASQRALAEGCSKRAAANGIAHHMATASVARDIVEIFERHGQWRDGEAKRLLDLGQSTSIEKRNILERTAYVAGKEKVQYWGISYGTILGATLAAMYPDRVHRVVLDGVADSHDYMRAGWTSNLFDTDQIAVKVAEYCFEGGAKHCPLYDARGPAAIADKLPTAMAKLAANPIAFPGNDTHGPAMVTITDLLQLISVEVYNPLRGFSRLYKAVQELNQGESGTLRAFKAETIGPLEHHTSSRCARDGPFSPACMTTAREMAGMGITCSDGTSRLNDTKETFREYAKRIMGQSKLLGPVWAQITLVCTAWHARPHWRYEGNFTAKTAHPLLFVGNTLDPVTPLRHAFMMAGGFEGAGVLQQNCEGHGTYASPSMCSGRALRRYFQTGQLPGSPGELGDWQRHGALCEPNRRPFDGYEQGKMPELPHGEHDDALWEALVTLNQVWP